ncbi:hypothetical protein V8C43DRAFT_37795 [Trichoderma afarasin]
MPDFRDILELFRSRIQYPVAPYRKPTLNWRNKLPLSSLAIISDYLHSVLRSLLGSLRRLSFPHGSCRSLPNALPSSQGSMRGAWGKPCASHVSKCCALCFVTHLEQVSAAS